MGGSGGWAVGVGHPWLLRLALDEVLCAGPMLHGGHLHDGMWGIPAQRGDPQQAFPSSPFHVYSWLLTKESCLPLMKL